MECPQVAGYLVQTLFFVENQETKVFEQGSGGHNLHGALGR